MPTRFSQSTSPRMRSRIRPKPLRDLTTAARRAIAPAMMLLLAFNCTGGDSYEPEFTTVTADLGEAACATVAPIATLTGGGGLLTNASYNPATCPSTYILNINDYATRYDLGTFVMYNGTAPADAATCARTRLSVHAYRRGSGTPALLGTAVSNGKWQVDHRGNGVCMVPRIRVDNAINGYVANNSLDYRLAIRAELRAASGSSFERKEIALSTLERTDVVARRQELRTTLATMPPGHVEPRINQLFAGRSQTRGLTTCRSNQLARTLYTFSKPSFIKAGASAAQVDSLVASIGSMHTALCQTGGTVSSLQTSAKSYLDARDAVEAAIASRSGASLPATLGPREVATDLISQVLMMDLGRLVGNCSVSHTAVFNYLASGTLPAGVSDLRLLLGSCSRTASEGAAEVAARLGVGGTRTATNTQAAIRACLAPLGQDGTAKDVCNDPRAADPATDTGGRTNIDPNACQIFAGGTTPVPCDQQGIDDTEQDIAVIEAYEAGREHERQKQTPAPVNPAPEAGKAPEAEETPWGTVVERLFDELPSVVFGPAVILLDLADEWNLIPNGQKPKCPNPPDCTAYCAADFAPTGYYGVTNDVNFGASPRQQNKFDRMLHCLCEAMEPEYRNPAATTFAVSGACPTQIDQLRQDCLGNPFGPDDAPRPECLSLLDPGERDNDTWGSRICQFALCPAGQSGEAFLQEDGTCGCGTPQRPLGDIGSVGCAWRGEVSYCIEESAPNCLCTNPTYGAIPFGNDPLCRLQPTAFPGTLDSWVVSHPNLTNVSRIANEDFLTYRTGTVSQLSAMSPMIYRNTLPNIGTTLRSRTVISRSRPASTNLDLQLYCTNAGNNLFHGFMGSCRMNAQTPEVPAWCDITLNTGLRNQCLNGAFAFDFTVQAPTSYKGFIGVGRFEFGGTLETTPAAQLRPTCPAPDPGEWTRLTPPLWDALGGTPDDPVIQIPLGSGGTEYMLPPIVSVPYPTIR
jgi:hypothetical protein